MIRLHIVSTHRADLGHLEPLYEEAKKDDRFEAFMDTTGNSDWGLGCVILLQGDRTELLEVAARAIRWEATIAHAAGGEVTKGSTDNAVRDAITKLAHLHYPVHEQAARRIKDLGEEPWRIRIVGEIGHDADMTTAPCPVEAYQGDLVIAYHPVTARPEETRKGLDLIRDQVSRWNGRVWLTAPNGDPGSEQIEQRWRELQGEYPQCRILASLGHEGFRALIRTAGMIMGNSSAILTEAPMLGAYPILIGTRQEGRQMSAFEPGASKLILDHIAANIDRPDLRVK